MVADGSPPDDGICCSVVSDQLQTVLQALLVPQASSQGEAVRLRDVGDVGETEGYHCQISERRVTLRVLFL